MSSEHVKTDEAGKKYLEGEEFRLDVVPVTQERFDKNKAKVFLTDVQFKACLNVIDFTQLKGKRLKGEKAAFEMPNLHNVTVSGLVDLLGKIREEQANLKKLEGVYKMALAARASLSLGGDD